MEHQSLFSFSNPEFWVLAALVIFFGLLVVLKVLPGALFGALTATPPRSRPSSTKPSNCGKRPRPCSRT